MPADFLLGLATASLDGAWKQTAIVRRVKQQLGRTPRWLSPLVRRLLEAFPGPQSPTLAEVREFLRCDTRLQRAYRRAERRGETFAFNLVSKSRTPIVWPPWLEQAGLPQLPTVGTLAAYVGVTPPKLLGFTRASSGSATSLPGPWQHYTYRWFPKRGGGYRLLEAPKARLKACQHQILFGILDCLPPHPAAHAFRAGRSTRSYVAAHAGQAVVLKFDLRHFFATITAARVAAVFRTIGYSDSVAKCLASVCTTATPGFVWNDPRVESTVIDEQERALLARRHLPQGAPTSPALANLCAYRLDVRLHALAAAAGGTYTRYADDLLFSGDAAFARGGQRFAQSVAARIAEEGFVVHTRKTRVMRASVRQHAVGLVINEKPNIDRRDYDLLKAILTNCIRHGAASQNRAGHEHFLAYLSSSVAYIAQVNPTRGEKLQRLLERIEVWE